MWPHTVHSNTDTVRFLAVQYLPGYDTVLGRKSHSVLVYYILILILSYCDICDMICGPNTS